MKSKDNLLIHLLPFAGAAWAVFCHLATAPLWKPEGRVAEVVREMFVRGDFLHPTSSWIPHVSKPIIPYWFVALASIIHGELDEFSLRLPAAIAAMIALVALWWMAGRLFSRTVAAWSVAVMGSCYGFVLWARCGAADILSLAGITLSVSWYVRWKEAPSAWNGLVLGILLALAAQMKGLVGLAIPAIAIFLDLIMSKRIIKVMGKPWVVPAVAAGLSLYLLPLLISSYTADQSGFNWLSRAFHESVVRFLTPFDHKGSPLMYIYFVPIWLMPWTPLLAWASYRALKEFTHLDHQRRWLTVTIGAIFLFFTAAGSRRSYYILPILPFCAILTASYIKEALDHGKGRGLPVTIQGVFFLLLGLSMAAAPVAVPHAGLTLPKDLGTTAFIHGLAIVAVSSGALMAKAPLTRAITLMVPGILLTSGLFCLEKPILDAHATEKPFILDVKAMLGRNPQAVPAYFLVGARPRTRLSFYLDRPAPVSVLRDRDDLSRFIKKNRDWIIICVREDRDRLLSGFKELGIEGYLLEKEKSNSWDGWPRDQDLNRAKRYMAYGSRRLNGWAEGPLAHSANGPLE